MCFDANKADIKKKVLANYEDTKSGEDYINFYKQLTNVLKNNGDYIQKLFPKYVNNDEMASFIQHFLDRDKSNEKNLLQNIKNDNFKGTTDSLYVKIKENEQESKNLEDKNSFIKYSTDNPVTIDLFEFKTTMSRYIKCNKIIPAILSIMFDYSNIYDKIAIRKDKFTSMNKFYVDTNCLYDFIVLGEIIIGDILKYMILFNSQLTNKLKESILINVDKYISSTKSTIINLINERRSLPLPYKGENNMDIYSDYLLRNCEYKRRIKIINYINEMLESDHNGNNYTDSFYNNKIEGAKVIALRNLIQDPWILEDNVFRNIENEGEFNSIYYETYICKLKYLYIINSNSKKLSLNENNKKGKLAKSIVKYYVDAAEIDDKEFDEQFDKFMFLDLKFVRGYFRTNKIMDLFSKFNKIMAEYRSIVSDCITTNYDIFIYLNTYIFTYCIINEICKTFKSGN